MNERRSFLKGLGLFAAGSTGAASAHPSQTNPVLASTPVPIDNSSVPDQTIDHLAPAETNRATIRFAGYNEAVPTDTSGTDFDSQGFIFASNPKETNSVVLSVGKDDRLWIKVGDKWKRLAIEG